MNFAQAPKCPRCDKSVYLAERAQFLGSSYHKGSCFTCKSCNKGLNLQNAEDHEGELYCPACSARLFRPKGYGFGGGAGTLHSTGIEADGKRASKRSSRRASSSNKATVSKVAQPSPTSVKASFEDRELKAKASAASASAVKKPAAGARAVSSRFGGAPKCKRCTKSVYQAEQIVAIGATWHKSCFACGGCKKVLNLHNGIDHDGQPFCGSCHAKKFGPKGIGYGNTLGDTGIARMDE